MVVLTFRGPATVANPKYHQRETEEAGLIERRAAAGHNKFVGLPGLLSLDSIQVILKIDEREKDGHEQIEPKTDRLAPVVVVEEFFANFEDRDDPQEPGEKKSGGKGSKSPVEG